MKKLSWVVKRYATCPVQGVFCPLGWTNTEDNKIGMCGEHLRPMGQYWRFVLYHEWAHLFRPPAFLAENKRAEEEMANRGAIWRVYTRHSKELRASILAAVWSFGINEY